MLLESRASHDGEVTGVHVIPALIPGVDLTCLLVEKIVFTTIFWSILVEGCNMR